MVSSAAHRRSNRLLSIPTPKRYSCNFARTLSGSGAYNLSLQTEMQCSTMAIARNFNPLYQRVHFQLTEFSPPHASSATPFTELHFARCLDLKAAPISALHAYLH
ncbi:hypothetical protein S83_035822 [Arachis hypogaea]|nr:uncharacterized protein DS421_11g337390 [Arachis hypogaea]